MLDTEDKVQGVGVYAEFRQPGQTLQMFITPDAYTTKGEIVPMSIHRRIVTPETPKKPWKRTSLESATVLALVTTGKELRDDKIEETIRDRMKYGFSLLDEMINKGWEAIKEPFVFEVTQIDADDISADKTPNKTLYRIHISRKALGYPAELI